MIELKLQCPFIDKDGVEHTNLEKHYAEDENCVRYKILQVETGEEYDDAVDVVPCRYTYKPTTNKITEVEDGSI